MTNTHKRWLWKWFDSIQTMTASWRRLRRIDNSELSTTLNIFILTVQCFAIAVSILHVLKVNTRYYSWYVFTLISGSICPVVGRVSMNVLTFKLPKDIESVRKFWIMSADFNDVNYCASIGRIQKTKPTEVCTNIPKRVPRLYAWDGSLEIES